MSAKPARYADGRVEKGPPAWPKGCSRPVRLL